MASIVYQTNPKTGVKYAYYSESYRDPVTKKPTSRRRYLGRVDPRTNTIIEKAGAGKRNRSKLDAESVEEAMENNPRERIAQLESQVASLQKKLNAVTSAYKEADALLKQIIKLGGSYLSTEI